MPIISQTFSTGGVNFSFVVPAGITELTITAKGGDGGRSNQLGSPSGRGALFSGKLTVTPLETIGIRVGAVGGVASSSSGVGSITGGTLGGGNGGNGPAFNRGGGGGGYTRLFRGASTILIVAGGGGAKSRMDQVIGTPVIVGDGSSPNISGYPGSGTLGGGGATAGSGGAAGDGLSTAGGSLFGGNGAAGTGTGGVGTLFSGGGGGAGLFGGGGGGRSILNPTAGGGGGGISWISIVDGWHTVTWPSDIRVATITETTSFVSGFNGNVVVSYNTDPIIVGGWALGLRRQLS